MTIYPVDGERRLHDVASITPGREGLVGLLVWGLLDICAALCDSLACVVLIGGICLNYGVLYDLERHVVLREVARLL